MELCRLEEAAVKVREAVREELRGAGRELMEEVEGGMEAAWEMREEVTEVEKLKKLQKWSRKASNLA